MPKVVKIILRVLLIVIAVLAVVLLLVHFLPNIAYGKFYNHAKKEYQIPDLDKGFIPQGLSFDGDDTEEYSYACGYMKDKTASRIYRINKEHKTYQYVTLMGADGKPYTGHTGGMTIHGDYFYLANDGEGDDNCVWVMEAKTVREALNQNGSVILDKCFTPETRSAYCYVANGLFYVGEFHNDDYQTANSHKTEVGETTYSAWIAAYALDESKEYGIDLSAPKQLYAVRDEVQGMCVTANGSIVLSTSYGLSASHLLIYDGKGLSGTTVSVNGSEVTLSYLNAVALKEDIALSPMSEEIYYQDGRLSVITESASNKYIFGKLIQGNYVYSYQME